MKILENSSKIIMLLLCLLCFSLGAMEPPVEPQEPQEVPEQIEQGETAAKVEKEQKEAVQKGKMRGKRRGYRIRCKDGICRVKGNKKAPTPPMIQKVANTLEKTEAAKSGDGAIFVYTCDKKKCGVKRKGLRRGKGKIRCKDGYCRIKGKGRGRWGARKQLRLEAYRKRLEAMKKGKTAPATYKVKCSEEKCDMKQKVAGKKWGGRRRGRRGSRRRGYWRRRTA